MTEFDIAQFLSGTHTDLASFLGAHHDAARGGTQFSVWAPHAESVSVIGDFNGWNRNAHCLQPSGGGIWSGFVPHTYPGTRYKYHVTANRAAFAVDKADPFAFSCEPPPDNASRVYDLRSYRWNDGDWMARRLEANRLDSPQTVYEVHLGSWRRAAENRWLSYSQLADLLIPYVKEMGFTHVEFLPVMEHPFYGSWGYQITGYFAPTARYGSPRDFMALVDRFHQNGIGVILDWVPSHFPRDEHGLGFFDGQHEYEPADPRRGFHPDWNSYIFDYGRSEVRSFLLSSALFWLKHYHADALRVDAVASMLYLDYSRAPGEWLPNRFGGNQNLDAISFLQRLNNEIARQYPDVRTVAEESTAYPAVTGPHHGGSLGFDMKWDMGWMHDTLAYLSRDPIERKYVHSAITFRAEYAFTEKFVLPLSHDEVVYGKSSLLGKMPGSEGDKFANLRLLLAYMYAQPGKKLLFMGDEFGIPQEWNHDAQLDWACLERPEHAGVRLLTGQLNHLYRTEPAFFQNEYLPDTFRWIERNEAEHNIVAFLRQSNSRHQIMVICNFSGVAQYNVRLGVPRSGKWIEFFNSDAIDYGGRGVGNSGRVHTVPIPLHGFSHSLTAIVPALGVLYLRPASESESAKISVATSLITAVEEVHGRREPVAHGKKILRFTAEVKTLIWVSVSVLMLLGAFHGVAITFRRRRNQ